MFYLHIDTIPIRRCIARLFSFSLLIATYYNTECQFYGNEMQIHLNQFMNWSYETSLHNKITIFACWLQFMMIAGTIIFYSWIDTITICGCIACLFCVSLLHGTYYPWISCLCMMKSKYDLTGSKVWQIRDNLTLICENCSAKIQCVPSFKRHHKWHASFGNDDGVIVQQFVL